MSDDSAPPPDDDLGARLRAARAKRGGNGEGNEEPSRGSGLSLAFRIGVELVAALIVGVGIGVLLDRWLGTAPWLLLLFFILGGAAGVLNVFRVMGGYGYTAGYRKPPRGDDGT